MKTKKRKSKREPVCPPDGAMPMPETNAGNSIPLPKYKPRGRFQSQYMIWIEGGALSTTRHDSRNSALAEAERVCRATGQNVYVLMDIWKCEPTSPPVKWLLGATVIERGDLPRP